MDINRLNEFITLATLLNYSKAANQLYLTQPALSRHIHDLEQTLGTQLFIRDTHNVHLTSVGEIFLKEAQEIIQRYNHALDLIKEVNHTYRGNLLQSRCTCSEGNRMRYHYPHTARYNGTRTGTALNC